METASTLESGRLFLDVELFFSSLEANGSSFCGVAL